MSLFSDPNIPQLRAPTHAEKRLRSSGVYCVLRSLRRMCVDAAVYCTEAARRVQVQLSVYLGTKKQGKMSYY